MDYNTPTTKTHPSHYMSPWRHDQVQYPRLDQRRGHPVAMLVSRSAFRKYGKVLASALIALAVLTLGVHLLMYYGASIPHVHDNKVSVSHEKQQQQQHAQRPEHEAVRLASGYVMEVPRPAHIDPPPPPPPPPSPEQIQSHAQAIQTSNPSPPLIKPDWEDEEQGDDAPSVPMSPATSAENTAEAKDPALLLHDHTGYITAVPSTGVMGLTSKLMSLMKPTGGHPEGPRGGGMRIN